jgi:hypothetical protein
MINLTSGVMFLLFTCIHFCVCGEFDEGGPRVRWPPVNWSTIAESLRNTGIVSDYRLYDRGSIPGRGKGIFL